MIIRIKQGREFYFRNIPEVRDGIVTEKWIHDQLIAAYYQTIETKNIEPFKINYGRGKGYCLVPSAYLGIIRSDQITLILESSIPGLDLGKILYLSAIAEIGQNANSSGGVIESTLDNELELAGIDYFVVSFLESLEQILNNGLIKSLKTVNIASSKLNGRIEVNRQIKKSPNYSKYHLKRSVYSPDIVINQVLLKAIRVSQQKTSLNSKLPLLKYYSEAFEGISENEIQREDFVKLLDEFTTLAREDYKKAMLLAEHIIFGFDPIHADNYDLFPEYLINLNEVFEKYIMNSLNRLFKSGFRQKNRLSLGLIPDPELKEKFLELDGFYEGNSQVVIDAKNKFTINMDRTTNFIPNNADIFQQYYYAKRTNSKNVILVYPSIKKKNHPISSFIISHDGCDEVNFLCWGLKITGSPKENRSAINILAKYIRDLN